MCVCVCVCVCVCGYLHYLCMYYCIHMYDITHTHTYYIHNAYHKYNSLLKCFPFLTWPMSNITHTCIHTHIYTYHKYNSLLKCFPFLTWPMSNITHTYIHTHIHTINTIASLNAFRCSRGLFPLSSWT